LTIAGNYFIFHFSRDTSILSDSVEVEFFGRWEALTFSSAESWPCGSEVFGKSRGVNYQRERTSKW
jgi:hypothetical protein